MERQAVKATIKQHALPVPVLAPTREYRESGKVVRLRDMQMERESNERGRAKSIKVRQKMAAERAARCNVG